MYVFGNENENEKREVKFSRNENENEKREVNFLKNENENENEK